MRIFFILQANIQMTRNEALREVNLYFFCTLIQLKLLPIEQLNAQRIRS